MVEYQNIFRSLSFQEKYVNSVLNHSIYTLILLSAICASGLQSLTLIAPAGMLDAWQFDLLRPLRCLYPCFRAILLAINSRPAGRDLCKARVRWRQK